jgi:hypothetical protein
MDDHPEGVEAMPRRRYEFRVAGRLSDRARSAFPGMDVTEVPAETVIAGDLNDDGGVQEILTMIQSLGLNVVSVRQASRSRAVRPLD